MIVFATPVFLWGLAASALPWILRRRLPREIPRIPFAFISFLREVESQEFLSPRVQEWLLLLLRILIIVGLVLAAANPMWISGEWGKTRDQIQAALDTGGRDETVLLIDRSASMRRTVGGVSTWQMAVNEVKQILKSNPDRNWALGFWTDGNGMVATLSDQLHRGSVADLTAILDEAQPLDRSSDFQSLLRENEPNTISAPIMLITDRQASGWRGLLKAPPSTRPPTTPLWVLPLGDRPENGAWVEISSLSSFPWAIGFDEEIQAVVHQWGIPAKTDLTLELRLAKPESVVLAETACKLDPSPPDHVVVDHPVRLSMRLGSLPGEETVLPVELSLSGENGDQTPTARIVGNVPILARESVDIVGEGPILDAVRDCLMTEGSARGFLPTSVSTIEPVPLNHLVVTTVSSVLPDVVQCAAWIRQGGKCLLLIDEEFDPSRLNLLLRWEQGEDGFENESIHLENGSAIGESLADWPVDAWREWRSFIPGHSPSSQRIVYAQNSSGDVTDILGELNLALGRIVYINLGPASGAGALRSSLFPAAVIESLKSLTFGTDSQELLCAGSRIEDDLRSLSDEDRKTLEQTGLVRFVSAEETAQPGSILASPASLRSPLLALVILFGLIELWLANRGVSN
ncbi:MAG: BatA and WFA domain-containing protein [bacterium]